MYILAHANQWVHGLWYYKHLYLSASLQLDTNLPGTVFDPKDFMNKKMNWSVICKNYMLESARYFIYFGILS